jgi:hypothetical protein
MPTRAEAQNGKPFITSARGRGKWPTLGLDVDSVAAALLHDCIEIRRKL